MKGKMFASLAAVLLVPFLISISGAQVKKGEVTVEQSGDGEVKWILPGKRRVSQAVFGTIENPRKLIDDELTRVERNYKSYVKKLLNDYPFLVGLPKDLRERGDEDVQYVSKPTMYSDRVKDISDASNSLSVTYQNYIKTDKAGDMTDTPDKVKLNCQFQDPDGNSYKITIKNVVMLRIPGYETAGGVLMDGYQHGTTGTGTPLLPEVYTYGGCWALADISIDGSTKSENKNRLVQIMTSETLRDSDYRLAIEEEMPLIPEQRFDESQPHQTHIMVHPIRRNQDKKLVHEPMSLPYSVDGEPQSFIAVSFDSAEITSGLDNLEMIPSYLK